MNHEDPRLLQALTEGIAGHHRSIQNVAPLAGPQCLRHTKFQLRNIRRVFHIEADPLATGRLEQRRSEHGGLFGIGIGQHQHPVAVGCLCHCGCSIVQALGGHTGCSQNPHQVVVLARRDQPCPGSGNCAGQPHQYSDEDCDETDGPSVAPGMRERGLAGIHAMR